MKDQCPRCQCKLKVHEQQPRPLQSNEGKPHKWWQTPIQLAGGPTSPANHSSTFQQGSGWSEFLWQFGFFLLLLAVDGVLIASTIAYAGGAEVKAPRGKNLTPEELERIPMMVSFASIFFTVFLVYQATQVRRGWKNRHSPPQP